MKDKIELALLNPVTDIDPATSAPRSIDRIVLRAPRLREYAQIGDLDSYARTPDGTMYMTENEGVFDRYLSVLIEHPASPAIAGNISLTDAMRLKDALRDFFTKSRAVKMPGKEKENSSE